MEFHKRFTKSDWEFMEIHRTSLRPHGISSEFFEIPWIPIEVSWNFHRIRLPAHSPKALINLSNTASWPGSDPTAGDPTGPPIEVSWDSIQISCNFIAGSSNSMDFHRDSMEFDGDPVANHWNPIEIWWISIGNSLHSVKLHQPARNPIEVSWNSAGIPLKNHEFSRNLAET